MRPEVGDRAPKPELVAELRRRGIIAAVRLHDPKRLPPTLAALAEGGLRTVDLAYEAVRGTVGGAVGGGKGLIHGLKEDGLLVGIGGVTRSAEAREAGMLGADFVVAAATAPDVASACRGMGLPCILSGVTPTEVWRAHEMGADLVKVVAAEALGGPCYIRSLREAVPARQLVGAEMPLAGYLPYLREGIEILEFKDALDLARLAEKEGWEEIRHRASRIVQALDDWRSGHDRRG